VIDTTFVALDTTGIPGKVPSFSPLVISIGLARTRAGVLVSSTGGYVRQERSHVLDARAEGAFWFSGIDPKEVLSSGTDAEVVAERLRPMLDGEHLRGFNAEFLHSMLRMKPWEVPSTRWGLCVMEQAARLIKFRKPNGDFQTRVPLNEALRWAAAEGYDVLPPDSCDHRAHSNAVRVAKLALAFEAHCHQHQQPIGAEYIPVGVP